MWIAHRGASAQAPQNTLKAFKLAERLGADAIEMDVQVTREGVPVVFHDQLLRRLTHVPGRLTAHTLAELKKIKMQGEAIPTLKAALEATQKPVFLEVKDPHGIEQMLGEAAPHKKRVTVISFYPRVLAKAKQHGFKTGLLSLTGVLGAGLAAKLKTDYLLVHSGFARKRLMRTTQARGAKLLAWGIRTPEHGRKLLETGVHGVVADFPIHSQTQQRRKVA